MGYDYQLVGGVLLMIFGVVGMANAMVEKRSPVYSFIGFLMGGGLVFWAWWLSDQALTGEDVPAAVFRIMAKWF